VLEEILKMLDFNRFNAHAISDATKEAISKTEEILLILDQINTSVSFKDLSLAYVEVSLKVGIYAAIIERDSKKGRAYLWNILFISQINHMIALCNKYDEVNYPVEESSTINVDEVPDVVKESNVTNENLRIINPEEYNYFQSLIASATSLILYVEAIDGKKEGAALLRKKHDIVIEQFQEIADNNPRVRKEMELWAAFNDRYVALALHRQCMTAKTAEQAFEFSMAAEKRLTLRLEIFAEQNIEQAFPGCAIDVAETTHLIGVAQKEQFLAARKYSLPNPDSFLINAENSLRKALVVWNRSTEVNHGKPHPIMYITKQSLADVLRLQIRFEESEKLYKEVLAEQIHFYGKKENTDVAKTYHGFGELYENMGNLPQAIEQLQTSLLIKEAISSNMKRFTQIALVRVHMNYGDAIRKNSQHNPANELADTQKAWESFNSADTILQSLLTVDSSAEEIVEARTVRSIAQSTQDYLTKLKAPASQRRFFAMAASSPVPVTTEEKEATATISPTSTSH
jgi:tetratricopeptide (TPR) repeat protein